MEDEQILQGGNVTQVARIGDTVRRSVGSWSQNVHDLLRYLERQGYDGSPRFLGIDDRGREMLSFIDGLVGHAPVPPDLRTDTSLADIGRFVRKFHNVLSGYSVSAGGSWQFCYPDSAQHELICHNDIAPYNMIFVDAKPRALIDFDMAGPGPRRWDVAYAAYRFVPLSHTDDEETALRHLGLLNPTRQEKRLQVFCDAYEMSALAVLETVEERLEALCAFMVNAAQNNLAFQHAISAGHLALYERDIAYVRAHRKQWEHMLST